MKNDSKLTLYFMPLACSMATRIVLDEVGADTAFVQVDPLTKRTDDDRPFSQINALTMVPVLRIDAQQVLTENAAILQYAGALKPEAELVPHEPLKAAQLRQWLSFIGTELHPRFGVLLNTDLAQSIRDHASARLHERLDWLETQLGEAFLLGTFTVADAYLLTILHWAQATPIELSRWPAVAAYLSRGLKRPSIARAIATELPLYLEEQKRRQLAAAS